MLQTSDVSAQLLAARRKTGCFRFVNSRVPRPNRPKCCNSHQSPWIHGIKSGLSVLPADGGLFVVYDAPSQFRVRPARAMHELPILSINDTLTGAPASSAGGCSSGIALALDGSVPTRRRLPPWLKRPLPTSEMSFTSQVIEDLRLETVCESAMCPNRTECWSHRTATFMILGNVCTRPCGFCSVPRGKTEEIELDEPERVAEAAKRLGLEHVVITCVTRDDLPDGGAEHFYRCVLAVREATGAAVEVLTSDFLGNRAAISRVVQARPDVFNHNTETVPRLYERVRRNARYQRTLDLLKQVKDEAPDMPTKSGLMLGLGETMDEVLDVASDLRGVGVEMLTIGQYLQPTPQNLPVERFVPPEEFDWIGEQCRRMGYKLVSSGPFVRSSYHAGEMAGVLGRA